MSQQSLQSRELIVFPSFLAEVQTYAATYMPIMFDSNLEIRISVSSCHPQKTESNLLSKEEKW